MGSGIFTDFFINKVGLLVFAIPSPPILPYAPYGIYNLFDCLPQIKNNIITIYNYMKSDEKEIKEFMKLLAEDLKAKEKEEKE